MAAQRIKRVIKRVLGLGEAPRFPVHDARQEGLGPVEAYYEYNGEPSVVRVELAACRWFGASGLSYAHDSPHPYIRTVCDYEAGDCTTYQGSYLQAYWRSWMPQTLAAYFGLDPDTCHPLLRETPPIHNILPWSPGSSIAYMEEVQWLEREDYHALWEAGCPPARSCGPKPDWFGEERFEHLITVYEKIKAEGYRRDPPETLYYPHQHIVGNCLVRGGEVCIVVANGQNRASALAALGHETAPVLVHFENHRGPTLVCSSDVERWPLVRRGIFSRDEALMIFDRIFDGKPPAEVQALSDARVVA